MWIIIFWCFIFCEYWLIAWARHMSKRRDSKEICNVSSFNRSKEKELLYSATMYVYNDVMTDCHTLPLYDTFTDLWDTLSWYISFYRYLHIYLLSWTTFFTSNINTWHLDHFSKFLHFKKYFILASIIELEISQQNLSLITD